MKGKGFYILPVVFVLIAIVVWHFFTNTKKEYISPLANPLSAKVSKVKSPSQKTNNYIDNAGFTFSYPDDLTITKIASSDSSLYSYVVMTSRTATGSARFRVATATQKSSEEWANNAIGSSSAKIQDIRLGDFSAKQFTLNNLLEVGAVDQGVLFTIEVNPENEKDYWENILSEITKSFSIIQTGTNASSGASSAATDDSVSVESEETVN